MRCAEIMTRDVKTVKTTDEVFLAARLMREHAIGFLPVCDSSGRVAGVITDRDLAMKVCAGDHDPVMIEVGDVMSRPVVTCRATHGLSYAESQMRAHGLTRIIVVDDRKRVRGVLSLSDIARHASKREVGGTLRDVTALKYAAGRR